MVSDALHLVLCDDHREVTRALARELPRGDSAPEWIELFPPGPEINAVDGRKFKLSDPAALIAKFTADPNPIPLDYEHATEVRAPGGQPAPAAGWIVALEERKGSVWARVDWTPAGAEAVKTKEYRFVSPAFTVTDGEIKQLVSAGLTNTPALRMTALANKKQETTKMDPEKRKALCKSLSLPETATDEQLVTAAEKREADHKAAIATARAESPSLANFVPRADYDAKVARVTELETAAAKEKAETLKAEIDGEIEAATKAGKITPATAEYHRAQCATEGGLERFRSYVKDAPKVVADSDLDGKKPENTGGTLTAEQIEIASNCGLTDKEYATGDKLGATH